MEKSTFWLSVGVKSTEKTKKSERPKGETKARGVWRGIHRAAATRYRSEQKRAVERRGVNSAAQVWQVVIKKKLQKKCQKNQGKAVGR